MKSLTQDNENAILQMLREYIPDADIAHLDVSIADLDISSMDFLTLAFDVEDKYNVDIEVSDIEMKSTLREFVSGFILTEQ